LFAPNQVSSVQNPGQFPPLVGKKSLVPSEIDQIPRFSHHSPIIPWFSHQSIHQQSTAPVARHHCCCSPRPEDYLELQDVISHLAMKDDGKK